jgi:hypothetical protein
MAKMTLGTYADNFALLHGKSTLQPTHAATYEHKAVTHEIQQQICVIINCENLKFKKRRDNS